MDQKSFEQTQKPKPRKKRVHKDKRLRVAGTTAMKKNRDRIKMNKYVLELEAENKRLKQKLEEYKKAVQRLAPRNSELEKRLT